MNNILEEFKRAFKTGNILYQLIIINLAVFLGLGVIKVILVLSQNAGIHTAIYEYLSLPSNTQRLLYQPTSIITYMFMHRDFFHILFNMLFLFWFGRIITEYLGQNKVLGLYVWGGIVGGLAYIITYNLVPFYANAVELSTLVGASAGVLAVVVGAATFQPDFTVMLFLLGPVKLKWIAIIVVVSSLFGTIGDNAGGEIAHLGGALTGFLFITQLRKGNDWSKPVASFVTWVKSFFTAQPKIRVSYRKEEPKKQKTSRASRSAGRSASRAAKSSGKTSQEEIDAILDKISEKGYDALSKEEKQKLFNASKD